MIGDSVIWGEYVTRHETLSHYLNELAGRERYANLGLDGAHPLALGGLVEFYADEVSGKNILLQCNPLWMSSRPGGLAGRPGERVQPSPAGPAVRPERSRLQGGDLATAGRAGGAAPPFEQLDDPPAASVLRADGHPGLDP